MYYWDASKNELSQFPEATVRKHDGPWCYFCNSKEHGGRTCKGQLDSLTDRSQLTDEIIDQWDHSREGNLKIGDIAPNGIVFSTITRQNCKLLDFTTGNVPLVLDFGSYSCLPFRNKTRLMNAMCTKYQSIANFLCIYILDAHPVDEWYLYADVNYRQPRNLEERCNVAGEYKKNLDVVLPLTVDLLDNNAADAYSAWPERLYIIQNGRIVYKGGTGPDNYHPEEVEDWLETFAKHSV